MGRNEGDDNRLGEEGRAQITQECGFYSKCNKKLLEEFKLGNLPH